MLTLHSLAAQLRAKAEAEPVEHPEAPHFCQNWQDLMQAQDDVAAYANQHKELQ